MSDSPAPPPVWYFNYAARLALQYASKNPTPLGPDPVVDAMREVQQLRQDSRLN